MKSHSHLAINLFTLLILKLQCFLWPKGSQRVFLNFTFHADRWWMFFMDPKVEFHQKCNIQLLRCVTGLMGETQQQAFPESLSLFRNDSSSSRNKHKWSLSVSFSGGPSLRYTSMSHANSQISGGPSLQSNPDSTHTNSSRASHAPSRRALRRKHHSGWDCGSPCHSCTGR